jgi:regulator of replication initiation timing
MANLRIRSELNSKPFNASLKGMGREVKGFGSQLKSMAGTIGVAFGVGAIAAFAKKVADFGSGITDLAIQTGLTTDQVQGLEIAMLRAGAAPDKMRTTISKLAVTMGQAQRGMTTYVALFDQVGIKANELAGLGLAGVFERIAQNTAHAERGGKKFGAMLELLGTRSGAQMVEVLQQISEIGFDGLIQSAKDAGQVIDQDLLQRLDSVADQIVLINRRIQVGGAVAGGAIADAVESLGAGLATTAEAIPQIVARLNAIEITGFDDIEEQLGAVVDIIGEIPSVFGANMEGAVQGTSKLIALTERLRKERTARLQALGPTEEDIKRAKQIEKLETDIAAKQKQVAFDALNKQEQIASLERERGELIARQGILQATNADQARAALESINAAIEGGGDTVTIKAKLDLEQPEAVDALTVSPDAGARLGELAQSQLAALEQRGILTEQLARRDLALATATGERKKQIADAILGISTKIAQIDSTAQLDALKAQKDQLAREKDLLKLKDEQAREEKKAQEAATAMVTQKAKLETDAAQKIADIKAGKGINVRPQEANRLARMGGFVGPGVPAGARTAERQLKTLKQILTVEQDKLKAIKELDTRSRLNK